MTDRTRLVFREMLREEWRLHSRLLGGRRFGAFPVAVGLLVAGTALLLARTGTSASVVFAGLHGLALVFGLHTGSIGFVGRDALRNLLGEVTLLVFSARTLPLAQSRLLGVFVVKDVVYYGVLFLLPMALGALPAVLAGGAGPVAAAGTLALLWATLTTTLLLGVGVTLAGVGLSGRGLPGVAVLAGAAVAAGLALARGVDVLAYTPYGVFLDPGPLRAGAAVIAVLAAFAVGAVTFDAAGGGSSRSVGPSFRRLDDLVGDPVTARTLLDVHRSSGGLGKVAFSAAVLFGVTAALVDVAGSITGVAPSVGVSFGAVLGLTGFTTYNWLTQFDDLGSYLAGPLDLAAVVRGKFRAFLALGPAVGLAFYAAGIAWRGARPLAALVGAVLLVGVACYVFGVTVYLAGLSPNEFLFDTVLFAGFGAAVALPLVPVLVVGFALAPVGHGLLAALGAGGLLLALAGVGLYRRALPRWTRHHRMG